MKFSSLASLTAITAILVGGGGYLTLGVAKVSLPDSHLTATLTLPESAGLAPRSKILLSGIQVGRITDVRRGAEGVIITCELDRRYQVPATGKIEVAELSALGEPYLEFSPGVPGGPSIGDGQSITADRVELPVSMPEVAQQMATLVGEVDPAKIESLIATFAQGLAGTEPLMAQIARSTDLLAAMLLSHNDAVAALLRDTQRIVPDMSWAGPSLTAASVPWAEFGPKVSDVVDAFTAWIRSGGDVPGDYLTDTPDTVALVPFLQQLAQKMEKLGPNILQMLPTLEQITATSVASTRGIDLGNLIEQALAATSPDGAVRLQIDLK